MKLYDFNAMGFEKLVNQSCLVVIPYQLERIEELILSVSSCKPVSCMLGLLLGVPKYRFFLNTGIRYFTVLQIQYRN